jgi:cytochrome c-type biogenesis protein
VVTGLDVAELRESRRDRALGVALDTGLFVAGFTAVFTVLGLSATGLGLSVVSRQLVVIRVSGVVVMAMGLFLLGSLVVRAPWMYREFRLHPRLGRFGAAAPLVAGTAFGFGWTPCIGPVLTSIYAIAATESRAWAGATLLAVYGLGLGVPFLVAGLAFGRVAGTLGWVRAHTGVLVVITGTTLAALGALLVLDRLTWVKTQVQHALQAVGLGRLVDLG